MKSDPSDFERLNSAPNFKKQHNMASLILTIQIMFYCHILYCNRSLLQIFNATHNDANKISIYRIQTKESLDFSRNEINTFFIEASDDVFNFRRCEIKSHANNLFLTYNIH